MAGAWRVIWWSDYSTTRITASISTVIPFGSEPMPIAGRAKREPGIHNHDSIE
jgi:hypothetical protein